ncbi:hypothetical protein LZ32DRAFT_321978 [Colletotrichum eremochloae]|nr:hypothetical protein LZ32DRAFT_321978 [Colletotrichum eremochloae]
MLGMQRESLVEKTKIRIWISRQGTPPGPRLCSWGLDDDPSSHSSSPDRGVECYLLYLGVCTMAWALPSPGGRAGLVNFWQGLTTVHGRRDWDLPGTWRLAELGTSKKKEYLHEPLEGLPRIASW